MFNPQPDGTRETIERPLVKLRWCLATKETRRKQARDSKRERRTTMMPGALRYALPKFLVVVIKRNMILVLENPCRTGGGAAQVSQQVKCLANELISGLECRQSKSIQRPLGQSVESFISRRRTYK